MTVGLGDSVCAFHLIAKGNGALHVVLGRCDLSVEFAEQTIMGVRFLALSPGTCKCKKWSPINETVSQKQITIRSLQLHGQFEHVVIMMIVMVHFKECHYWRSTNVINKLAGTGG